MKDGAKQGSPLVGSAGLPAGANGYIIGGTVMDERYRGIYKDLYYGRIEGRAPEYDHVKVVRNSIEAASEWVRKMRKVEVREDAKHFLLINTVDMIAIPISMAQGLPPDPSLYLAIDHDVVLLLDSAAGRAGIEIERPREVSAHRIVDALSRNWKKLRLSSFQIWDGKTGVKPKPKLRRR